MSYRNTRAMRDSIADIVGVEEGGAMALMRHPFLLGSRLVAVEKHGVFDLRTAFSASNESCL